MVGAEAVSLLVANIHLALDVERIGLTAARGLPDTEDGSASEVGVVAGIHSPRRSPGEGSAQGFHAPL